MIAALVILALGKHCQTLFHGLSHILAILIVSKSLQGHGSHIDLCLAAHEGPAAVFQLGIDNVVHIQVTGGLAASHGVFGDLIVAAIQCQQCKDRSIDTLENGLLEISQGLQHIEAAHIGRVTANGSHCQNHTGVLGVLLRVEDAALLRCIGAEVLEIDLVVFVRNLQTGSCQTHNQPFTADTAKGGICHTAVQEFAGLVNRIRQHFLLLFNGNSLIVVLFFFAAGS